MPPEKTYTEAEAKSLVESEVAKHRMTNVERAINDGERRAAVEFTELKGQITSLTTLVEKQSLAMERATSGLRDEIKKDFATKAEVSADVDRLNTKIDTQWSKLVLIVSTITLFITSAGVLAQFFIKGAH